MRHRLLLQTLYLVLMIGGAAEFVSPAAVQAAPGQVLTSTRTAHGTNGFAGTLANFDNFGHAVAALGDVDGAGPSVAAYAVGAIGSTSFAGAVWILFLDSAGLVIDEQRIDASNGGFTFTLDAGDQFGSAVEGLGDLDGDGLLELAVGAIRDDDGAVDSGAVYILELNTDGTVADQLKISTTSGGFGGTITGAEFGAGIANLGDVDGDGNTDIAVGAHEDDDGGTDRGAVWILFLDTDGSVLGEQKISDLAGGFATTLDNGDRFGNSVTSLGDLDGDGKTDIAVGAPEDDDGATGNGAVYVLFLDTDGTVLAEQKISDTAGGFTGTFSGGDAFGFDVAQTGDLNGDLINDLVVGAYDDNDGGTQTGAVWVLFLDTDGTVLAHQKISQLTGGMPAGQPVNGDHFGVGVDGIGDFDGDGIFDILVGAERNDTGGSTRGAIFQLTLDGTAVACGDSILGFGEDCDDGNNDPGDCCDADCVFEAAASPCADADLCNGDETCDGAGSCNPGSPLDCNDGEICTVDTCDPALGCEAAVASGCLLAAKSQLLIIDKVVDSKDKLKWKWSNGDATTHPDFGDPAAATTYHLCVFDEAAGVPQLVASLSVDPNGAWQDKDPKGWKYKDKAGVFDGVDKLQLKPGIAGKSKASIGARGVNLAARLAGPAGATYLTQDARVIVQLINDPEGLCWESEFTGNNKNTPEQFKAKAP